LSNELLAAFVAFSVFGGASMIKNKTYKLVLSALFIAIGIYLPFLTGQIPEIGSKLLPMHIPVLLCGFVCGGEFGLLAGFITPILRSLLFSMPPMYPGAVSMAFELAAYGFTAGMLFKAMNFKKSAIIPALLTSMVCGRAVWGIVRFVMTFVGNTKFSMAMFLAGAFVDAVPGIILQLVLIPILVLILQPIIMKADRR